MRCKHSQTYEIDCKREIAVKKKRQTNNKEQVTFNSENNNKNSNENRYECKSVAIPVDSIKQKLNNKIGSNTKTKIKSSLTYLETKISYKPVMSNQPRPMEHNDEEKKDEKGGKNNTNEPHQEKHRQSETAEKEEEEKKMGIDGEKSLLRNVENKELADMTRF